MRAKPLEVFRLGSKRILVCRLADGNPMQFLDNEFAFYAHGKLAGRIKIEGVSTASDPNSGVFDFSYTGDEIIPEQLDEMSVITDEGMPDPNGQAPFVASIAHPV